MGEFRISNQMLKITIFLNMLLLITHVASENYAVAREVNKMNTKEVSTEQWKKLAGKNIFFGHQSVGYNILDGVKKVQDENSSINFKIVKLESPSEFSENGQGVLFHAEMGSNFDPRSKIDDFAKWLDNGIGGKVDIAFLKFCFVDIGTKTDLESLFNYYKKTMAELKQKYPTTTIIHVTVPLVSEKTGLAMWKHKLKNIIKNIIGKNEFYENMNKFSYNEMIRKEYTGKEPVFDLARIESTFPDGRRLTFVNSGKNIESLVPAYTNDGGHLTGEGQRIVAENLLSFMANLN